MLRSSSLGLATALLALGCSGPSLEVLERHPNEFISREGAELRLRGQRYRFLSFNAFALTGGCGPTPNDAELDAFFQSLRPQSLVRTFAYESFAMSGIERVVASARAHGHKLILTLAAHAAACGLPEKDVAFYQSDFRLSYLPWVQRIVARFKDDPVIGMWEPINTPVGVDQLTLRTFFDVVGGEIHRIDSNHLVESGTHGPWAYDGATGYAFIHSSAGIDVASFRDYDTTHAEPPNLAPSQDALAGIAKPLILGEAGMYASIDGDPANLFNMMPCLSWTERKDRMESWLTAGFSTELAGVDIWNWSPTEQTTDSGCQYDTAPNDPLLRLVHDFPIP